MKNTKRVLITLLAVAMLVSGLLLSSYATEDAAEDTAQLPDYADILKFYDPLYSKLYDDESFEDGEFGGSLLLLDAAKPYTTVSVAGDENKYLAITLGHILNPDARTNAAYSVSFGDDTLSKVVFRASVSATHVASSGKVCSTCKYTTDNLSVSLCPNCKKDLVTVSTQAPSVVLALSENTGVGASFVTLDFASGKAYYTDGASVSYVDGLEIKEGSWYDVEIICDATQYKFMISDGEGVYSFTAVNSPVFSAKCASVGARYVDDARGATVMIDNVFVQAGIDDRNTGVDLYAETNEGFAIIDSLLRDSTVSVEVKNDVVAVFDTLMGTYADALALDETGEAHIASIRSAMLTFFAEQLKLATDAIDVSAAYTTRLALIEDNAIYAARISELLALVTDDNAVALLQIYADEKAALAALAAESDRFIAYIEEQMLVDSSVFSSEDYDVLTDFIGATEAEFEDSEGNVMYSATYPPIKDSLATYTVVVSRYNLYLEKSALFCESVALAKLAEQDLLLPVEERQLTDEEFMASLAAYDVASGVNFDNPSFPGMADALADFDSFVNIREISVVAERFITNVNTAKQAIYIFMKEEWLDAAEVDIDAADDRYAGVAEAKALYSELRLEIAGRKAAADAYIAAVKALDGKDGDELVAAIEAALALKDAGNVQGYEGVAEANIALDNAHKAYQLELAYAEKFITLTAAISDAETLEERFAAIAMASEAQGFANDKFEGVSEAKADLIAAISLYNADIAAINASYSSVASNASVLASAATSLTDIIKLVASAIKAIAG